MKILPHIWQRVLAYAFFLVLVAHAISFAMFKVGFEKHHHIRVVEEVASNMAVALEGRDAEDAAALLEYFNHPPRAMWIERPDGTPLLGEIPSGFGPEERTEFSETNGADPLMRILRQPGFSGQYLAVVPLRMQEGAARLLLYMGDPPVSPTALAFVHGLVAVSVIGGALSVWTAWRISRPLRRLRAQVLNLADGDLDKKVSEEGAEEVADVAAAVNRLAEHLSHTLASMRQLVANISHEMRSPLARISFSAAIIEENIRCRPTDFASGSQPPRAAQRERGERLVVKHLGKLRDEIAHMEKLIGSSLLNSRLDLHREELRLDTVDFSQLCAEFCRRHEDQLANRLRFYRHIEPNVRVEGDEALLGQVVSNLLDNAGKYTPDNGEVRLVLREERGEALLLLENTHPPLADDVLAMLFEPFYRGGLATGGGVGLGLALAKKIAERHKGNIFAHNAPRGLRIGVRLPLLRASSAFSRDFLHWFYARHGTDRAG